jgi:hypothetical protein
VILCTFYTVQYFDNFGFAVILSGRISLKTYFMANYHLAKFRPEIPTNGPYQHPAEFLFMYGFSNIFGQNHQCGNFYLIFHFQKIGPKK